MQKQELESYEKAGEIAKQVVAYAKEIIKPNMLLVELANKIHKDFLKKFKYARIWGSSRYNGQQVGLKHMLQDGDVIEFHMN